MRITAAQSEVLMVDTSYLEDEYADIFGPNRRHSIAVDARLSVQVKGGELVLDRDWRIFYHERIEYRPEFDDEHEAKFREWHDIPAGAEPVKVEKKNELIKASGYDVYIWKWVVVCTGKDIALEEEFTRGTGKTDA